MEFTSSLYKNEFGEDLDLTMTGFHNVCDLGLFLASNDGPPSFANSDASKTANSLAASFVSLNISANKNEPSTASQSLFILGLIQIDKSKLGVI
jgi:hypothetical protein